MIMLSKFFSLEELMHSDFAARKGIDNTPTPAIVENLKQTAQQADRVRAFLGCPVIVSSGYRSPKLNAAIGGSKTSSHMQGFALDIKVPNFGTPKQVFDALKESGIVFDQCILELPNAPGGGWVHIGFAPEYRNERLVYDGRNYRVA